MSKLVIEGGKKLSGQIATAGDKNSILPILAALILTNGVIVLENVPLIADVFNLIKILEKLGARAEWLRKNTLKVDTTKLHYEKLFTEEIKKLRGSILLLGGLLTRFKKADLDLPGGDIIGARPIDTHIQALEDLGAEIEINHKIIGRFEKIKNETIILKEVSVTATENIMIFCGLIEKEVNLRLIATEPSVQALGEFLQKLGVKIKGLGTNFITIKGNRHLKKFVRFKIPSDLTEFATFACLAAATKSKIEIIGLRKNFLDSFFLVAKEMNIKFNLNRQSLTVLPAQIKSTKIQTGLYPKFLSDMQPPFGVLATQARGVTLIHDWLYENRFGYLQELICMGANAEILDPHRALIIGPTPLIGKNVRSLDIRAGIAVLIAGLIAEGTTIIDEAEKIDRGYEKIEIRLKKLGARIERIN